VLQVLQLGLPRPTTIEQLPQPKAPAELAAMSLRERAEAELMAEVAALVQNDNSTYPIKAAADAVEGNSKKSKKRGKKGQQDEAQQQQEQQMVPKGPPLMQFDLAELEAAAALLTQEVEVVRERMGHAGVGYEEYAEAARVAAEDFVIDAQVSLTELVVVVARHVD
jgi:hypothetical protein